MIPTPAERRHNNHYQPTGKQPSAAETAAAADEFGACDSMQPVTPAADAAITLRAKYRDAAESCGEEAEEEDDDDTMMFNGFACHNAMMAHDELLHRVQHDELEEDEFEYLRGLDTIVEEEEDMMNSADIVCEQRGDVDLDDVDPCKAADGSMVAHGTTALRSESSLIHPGANEPLAASRPLAENRIISNNSVNNSMRKFTATTTSAASTTTTQSQQDTTNNHNNIVVAAAAANNNNNHENDNDNRHNSTSGSSIKGANISINAARDKDTGQQEQRAARNNKMQQQQQCLNQQLPLPSTNRLISEHQARQQQALFRCLAERQKMMDELGAGQRVDLMSAASLASSLRTLNSSGATGASSGGTGRTRRRRRSLSSSAAASGHGNEAAGGVPLSSVDLSSMSDRMLDELLGHIASASSSSLSSNGESLDSSDMSSTDEDDYFMAANHLSAGPTRGSKAPKIALINAPNVVGVHEDERTRPCGCANGSRHLLNCRDTHRRPNKRHEDDDDHQDHELVVHVGGDPSNEGDLGADSASLSPGAVSGAASHERCGAHAAASACGGSRLEQYFTSNLVRDFSCSAAAAADDDDDEPDDVEKSAEVAAGGENGSQPAVEQVLSRMLEALNEIGTDDQEQLNELLERGFAHLEQLLNCSLAPGSAAGPQVSSGQQQQQQRLIGQSNNQSSVTQHRSQPNLAQQKLISSAHRPHQSHLQTTTTTTSHQLSASNSTMLSKDSDYGSDTQSADCFSQFNDHTSAAAATADSSHHLQPATSQLSGGAHHQPISHMSPTHARFGAQVSSELSSDSPSPTSLTTSTSSAASSSATADPHRAASKSTSALSPLAIELSFKLAESLHRLAQQQAARRAAATSSSAADPQRGEAPQSAESGGAYASTTGTSATSTPISGGEERATPPTKRSPMKSIVMINATRSPSAASNVSSGDGCSPTGGSPAAAAVTAAAAANEPPLVAADQLKARNMTPTTTNGGAQDSPQPAASKSPQTAARLQFKTRVNIGQPSQMVAGSAAAGSAARSDGAIGGIATRAGRDKHTSGSASVLETGAFDGESEKKQTYREEEEAQVVKVTPTTTTTTTTAAAASISSPPVAAAFERRRSLRSSLRRQPSFSGSVASQTSGAREPRPGSPLPRPLLTSAVQLQQQVGDEMGSVVSTALRQVGSLEGGGGNGKQQELAELKEKQKQQQQLQRALILAQKYNYSPAKLAASKLSTKLHLNDLPSSSNNNHQTSAGIFAINGSQTLNGKGEVKNTTSGRSLSEQQLQRSCRQPQQQQRPISITGQVQLDISYFAKSGSLTIHVLQCSQLAPVSKRRTTSNPYVKLYLLPDRSKSGKRKSAIHRNQLDPKFDEKFTFGPLQLAKFDQKILWLSVWHKDRLGRNEFLGELLLPLSLVRQQLLTSDLCQSTSAKWYQLSDRFETLPGAKQQQLHADCIAKTTTTTERTGSRSTLTRQEAMWTGGKASGQSSSLDKLGELQRKADRLTTAVAAPSGATNPSATMMNVTLGPLAELGPNRAPITGQLFVALKFVADDRRSGLSNGGRSSLEGELQVMIKEARNIGGFDLAPLSLQASMASSTGDQQLQHQQAGGHIRPPAGSLPNPFCKCYLLASNGHRLAKQKTPHLKRTVNPRWDHKCQFTSIRLSNLASQALEIHMFNRDSILVSNNEYLGGVRLCRATATPSPSTSSTTSSSHYNNNEQNNDATSIASDQSSSDVGSGSRFSRQDSSGSGQQPHTLRRIAPQASADELDDGALCSERESRLWSQMLARPGIWVYGELKLRQLRPLVANRTNQSSNITPAVVTTTTK